MSAVFSLRRSDSSPPQLWSGCGDRPRSRDDGHRLWRDYQGERGCWSSGKKARMISLIDAIFKFFRENHFAYLAVNPLVMLADGSENLGEPWRDFKNLGEPERASQNLRESQRNLDNLQEQRISKNHGKPKRTLENLSESQRPTNPNELWRTSTLACTSANLSEPRRIFENLRVSKPNRSKPFRTRMNLTEHQRNPTNFNESWQARRTSANLTETQGTYQTRARPWRTYEGLGQPSKSEEKRTDAAGAWRTLENLGTPKRIQKRIIENFRNLSEL